MTTDKNTTGTEGMQDPVLIKRDNLEYFDAEWGQLTWYASNKQGNTKELTLGRCILYSNMSNPYHYHPNCDEILTVMQGKIAHTWKDGKEIEMTEGDTITIPSGMKHQARNIGEGNAVLTIVFTSADRQTIGENL
jgi:quercetin dioxygenase-like cupin family protein